MLASEIELIDKIVNPNAIRKGFTKIEEFGVQVTFILLKNQFGSGYKTMSTVTMSNHKPLKYGRTLLS